MTTDYKVKLDIFEGPLDLLLHLIRQNEMEISEISISAITTQYLDYLRLMETLDLEVAGDYLVMAASLLNIKLRSLLPAVEEEAAEEQEEELDNFISARQLMQRLIEYRKFKEAGRELGGRAERQARVFLREVALPKLSEAQKDDEFYQGDLQTLLDAFARIIKFIDRRDFHQVQAEEYRIEDKITMFRRRLVVEPRVALSEVFRDCQARLEMIVTVIAILELCRLKELRVRQNDRFGEVFIFRTDAAPEEEYEAGTEDGEGNGRRRAKKLAAAAALERIEAEIIASRTGFVDDGVIPDDEDALLDEMMRAEGNDASVPVAAEAVERTADAAATAFPEPSQESSDGAGVIEISPVREDRQAFSETGALTGAEQFRAGIEQAIEAFERVIAEEPAQQPAGFPLAEVIETEPDVMDVDDDAAPAESPAAGSVQPDEPAAAADEDGPPAMISEADSVSAAADDEELSGTETSPAEDGPSARIIDMEGMARDEWPARD